MKKKLRVALLFGGKSAEHEISLISARNIAAAMDKTKYDVVAIGIDKQGRWHLDEDARLLRGAAQPAVDFQDADNIAAVLPGDNAIPVVRGSGSGLGAIDVVFPVLHGPFGEDGTVQGLLKLANIPFVGAGVLGSAVGMDKDVMKRLLRDAQIPIAKFLVFERSDRTTIAFAAVKRALGLPLFVKPANLGSSVGISKVTEKAQFGAALKHAFRYDNKIIIEEGIHGREIECSVLGNEKPIASLPGEIVVTRNEWYDFEAKYEEGEMDLVVPARVTREQLERAQELAVRAFVATECEGMARVDLFVRDDGEVLVNELNTIPGFTSTSVYAKLFEATGVGYVELLERLVALARERHDRRRALRY